MRRVKIIVLAAAVAVSLLLAACSDQTGEEKTAAITISVGGANSRTTVWPLPMASGIVPYLTHEITITSTPGDDFPITETLSAGVTSKTIPVAPGTWTVTVDGYFDDIPFATATDTVTVAAGQTARATIVMAQASGSPDFYVAPDVTEWNAALTAISGSTLNAAIVITGDFSPPPSASPTFGTTTGTVKIYGAGGSRQLNLSSGGNLLSIGANQEVTVKNVKLIGMTSNTGGALINVSGNNAKFIMKGNSEVCNNENNANPNGGGVYVSSGTFAMYDNAKVQGNKSTFLPTSVGGGVYLTGSTSFIIMDGNASVYDNVANSDGGGVFVVGSATFTMKGDAKVYSNKANSNGGGIVGSGANITIEGNASVYSNEANASGGGVYASNGPFTMQGNALVSGNTAKTSGGGVYFAGTSGTFTMQEQAKVSGNKAGVDGTSAGTGGGVHIQNSGPTFIMKDSSSVSGNTAVTVGGTFGQGGGVYVNNSAKFHLEDGIVYGSSAAGLRNTAGEGASLYVGNTGTSVADHGTGTPTDFFTGPFPAFTDSNIP